MRVLILHIMMILNLHLMGELDLHIMSGELPAEINGKYLKWKIL